MNALRWNPNGYAGNDFNISFQSVNIYENNRNAPINFNLLAQVSTNNISIQIQRPYASKNMNCPIMTITNAGVYSMGSYPFGPYLVNTPLRPFCIGSNIGPDETSVGDFKISSEIPCRINISTAIRIDSSMVFPKGFTPITFTGVNSQSGSMYSGIKIDLYPKGINLNALITLPQVTYPPDSQIRVETDIAIFKIDVNNGRMYYISAISWKQDSAPLLSITARLQDGIYIFGKFTRNIITDIVDLQSMPPFVSSIPIEANNYISVYKDLGVQKFALEADKFQFAISSTIDTTLSISPPKIYYPQPDGWKVHYLVYIRQYNVVPGPDIGFHPNVSIFLQKQVDSVGAGGAAWAFAPQSIMGDVWNFSICATNISYSGISRETSEIYAVSNGSQYFGLYALMERVPLVSGYPVHKDILRTNVLWITLIFAIALF